MENIDGSTKETQEAEGPDLNEQEGEDVRDDETIFNKQEKNGINGTSRLNVSFLIGPRLSSQTDF